MLQEMAKVIPTPDITNFPLLPAAVLMLADQPPTDLNWRDFGVGGVLLIWAIKTAFPQLLGFFQKKHEDQQKHETTTVDKYEMFVATSQQLFGEQLDESRRAMRENVAMLSASLRSATRDSRTAMLNIMTANRADLLEIRSLVSALLSPEMMDVLRSALRTHHATRSATPVVDVDAANPGASTGKATGKTAPG